MYQTVTATCKNVMIFTTINAITATIEKAASVKDWCVVVVADKKTPVYTDSRITFLSVEEQEGMFPDVNFCKLTMQVNFKVPKVPHRRTCTRKPKL